MATNRIILTMMAVLLACTFAIAAEYEIGGPLAGEKLPLYKTQHGEPAGHPGSLPEKMATAGIREDGQLTYKLWGPQEQAPQLELYPGSVEHWRAYMFKYMPVRSFFDRQSQSHNWAAPNIPGALASAATTYAEPVYWVPRHKRYKPTNKKNKPVPVIRSSAGSPAFDLDLGELELTPVTLANLFTGDGSSSWRPDGRGVVMSLCVQNFSIEDVSRIQEQLSNKGIKVMPNCRRVLTTADTASILTLMDIVEPYIVPSYRYKIKRPRGKGEL